MRRASVARGLWHTAAGRVAILLSLVLVAVLALQGAGGERRAPRADTGLSASDNAAMWFGPIDGNFAPETSADSVGISGFAVKGMTSLSGTDLSFPLGSAAFEYSGDIDAGEHARGTMQIYESLAVPVTDSSVLTYLIRPDNPASAGARIAAHYTDLADNTSGTISAPAAGLVAGRWNTVTVDLAAAEGDVIDGLSLSIDSENTASATAFAGQVANVAITPSVAGADTVWHHDAHDAARKVLSVTLTAEQHERTRGLYGVVSLHTSAAAYVNGVRVAQWDDGPGQRILSVPGSLLRTGVNTVAVTASPGGDGDDNGADIMVLTRLGTYLPAPYTPAELDRHYPSDKRPATPGDEDYRTRYLADFTRLLTDDPDILAPPTALADGDKPVAANDLTVMKINNRATAGERRGAIADATGERYEDLASSLGPLAEPFRAAMAKRELPKTVELLTNRAEDHIGHGTADIKDAFRYPRPFVRLGFRENGGHITPADSSSIYDDVRGSWSFPSGHTIHGYTSGILLATLIPEEGPQILARTSTYANHRIVLGVHYPMDVIGGRIVGTVVPVRRWSDPEFRPLLWQAKAELDTVLAEECGTATVADCIGAADAAPEYLPTDKAVSVYTERLTYGFPQVHEKGVPLVVPEGAEDLLLSSHPGTTDAQRRAVLRQTALDSGYPLDLSDAGKPGRQRLNLAAAFATAR